LLCIEIAFGLHSRWKDEDKKEIEAGEWRGLQYKLWLEEWRYLECSEVECKLLIV